MDWNTSGQRKVEIISDAGYSYQVERATDAELSVKQNEIKISDDEEWLHILKKQCKIIYIITKSRYLALKEIPVSAIRGNKKIGNFCEVKRGGGESENYNLRLLDWA